MHIDSIKNGVVIDHIKAGKSMEIYHHLELDKLDCTVAIIKHVNSKKMGYKDMGYLPGKDSQVFGKWLTPETEAEIAEAAIRK